MREEDVQRHVIQRDGSGGTGQQKARSHRRPGDRSDRRAPAAALRDSDTGDCSGVHRVQPTTFLCSWPCCSAAFPWSSSCWSSSSGGEFGSDLLAGISIVTSVLLGEYLAGTLVVLMLSGGEALEAYAVRSASSVLQRPGPAHAVAGPPQAGTARSRTCRWTEVAVGDTLVVFPHEICPVDGTVVEGHGVMDESYLTGEPYLMSKTPGSAVLSGAINGETALTIRADKLAVDSRYAKIMQVMRASEQRRPRLRRLGDQLGAFYTPLAVAIALVAWAASGEPIRFLAVLVVATPVPAADRHPGGHHRRRSRWRPGAASSSRTRPCWRRSTPAAPPSSTRPAR